MADETLCPDCHASLPHVEDAAKFACRVIGQMMRAATVDDNGSVTIPFTLEMVDVALGDDLPSRPSETNGGKR